MIIGRRILILAPHPDDEVVGCCAAILRARDRGARIFVAFLTDGVPPREQLWPWDRGLRKARVQVRRTESETAARQLGLEPVSWASRPSRTLKAHLATEIERISTLARAISADRIWTPAYEGGHEDHDATSFIASRIRDVCPVFEFSEYNFAGARVRSQEFFAPNGTELTLDLTDHERSVKRRTLAIYRSEKGSLAHVRTEHESFRPLAHYDYHRPPHAGRTFYQRWQWVPWHPRIDRCRPEELSRAVLAVG
jgi:LmbE family N-acetylglucosaminyl deacetylase